VSVGDGDVVKGVLNQLCGEVMRWMQVAVKPAKPFAFGTLASTRTPAFGLPGNPVSALVSYELFIRSALRAMAGYQVLDRACLTAITEADLSRRRDGKLHLLRVLVHEGADGTLRVRLSAVRTPTCCGPWPRPTRWRSNLMVTVSQPVDESTCCSSSPSGYYRGDRSSCGEWTDQSCGRCAQCTSVSSRSA
jgi:hypothetical protein